jgi:hypothetical protein
MGFGRQPAQNSSFRGGAMGMGQPAPPKLGLGGAPASGLNVMHGGGDPRLGDGGVPGGAIGAGQSAPPKFDPGQPPADGMQRIGDWAPGAGPGGTPFVPPSPPMMPPGSDLPRMHSGGSDLPRMGPPAYFNPVGPQPGGGFRGLAMDQPASPMPAAPLALGGGDVRLGDWAPGAGPGGAISPPALGQALRQPPPKFAPGGPLPPDLNQMHGAGLPAWLGRR